MGNKIYMEGKGFIMKKNLFSRIFCYLLATVICLFAVPIVNVDAATVITENKTGTEDGYAYELWKDSGNTSMTLTGGGTFSCEWSNINNCLFRKGRKYDCTQTYQELGNMTIEYGVDYQPNGNSYMCVYGWTKEPLVEYYIVETWGSWRPPGATESLGQIEADGGTYDIYKTVRIDQPSIIGNTTFDQYWSVRTTKPTANGTKIEGTISVSEHFKAWEKVGLKMGKMYEVALNIEGYQSSGKANVYKNNLTVGGEISDDDPLVDPDEPVEPDADGFYFHDTFEETAGEWTSRGDASTSFTTSEKAAGSKSLSITGRTDSWNGAARSLNTSTFKPGSSYSFSAYVMQNVTDSEDFKLSLQYDVDGETNYAQIAESSGLKGEWIQLANKSYTIPSGASNLLLYVETADSTNSFYLDEAAAAPKGTSIGIDIVPDIKKGDVNNDNKIDSEDIQILSDYLVKKISSVNSETADMDENGKLNVFDLVILKRTVNNASDNNTQDSENTSTGAVDISWIDPSKPMVAIAFDDGAVGTADTSPSIRIQNALRDSGFHATFFYVGDWINSANQGEIKRAYDLGMEIGNHTRTHTDLTTLSAEEIRKEYDDTSNKIKGITGQPTSPVMRPPYLSVDDKVKTALNDVALINCSIDTGDWAGATKDEIINKITTAMNNGSLDNAIVLAHETYDTTAEAMEYLAPYLKSQGWQIVTVSELFAVNGKELKGGNLYNSCK